MIGTQAALVAQIVANINTSIALYATSGVSISQVNLVMPDGRALVLIFDAEAVANGDGTFTGDWIVETHA